MSLVRYNANPQTPAANDHTSEQPVQKPAVEHEPKANGPTQGPENDRDTPAQT